MRRPFFKLFAASGIVVFFTACATTAPPLPPSLDLPKPPSDLRAARKSDSVNLTWSIPSVTTDRQRARSFGLTRVCRVVQAELNSCGTPVGQVSVPVQTNNKVTRKVSASYTDTIPPEMEQGDASGFATYAVEVTNADGRSAGLSNQVKVPLVQTFPPFEHLSAQVTAGGIQIAWRVPPSPGRAPAFDCKFRVYRRLEGSKEALRIVDIDYPHCLGITKLLELGDQKESNSTQFHTSPAEPTPSSYLDQSFEWEKTYYYHGTVVTVVEGPGTPRSEVEGSDTPEVKIFADDVFPPAVPSGLQAVFSGPGQKLFVDLIWAPVPDIDLDGYNIYRREENSQAVKLNATPVKAPAYRDVDVASGKRYFYSVSAIDVRGNESARSEEAEESIP